MCPSEVSDIDGSIHAEYGPRGVEVWAIGVHDQQPNNGPDSVAAFAEALGLELPVLLDPGSASALYPLDSAFPSAAFPKEFVVGADGRVIYVNNRFEAESLRQALDQELAR